MKVNSSQDNALESPGSVIEIADSYSAIADSLHHVLNRWPGQFAVSTEKAYALLTEEYGLRVRLGILRSDAANRTVIGVNVNHAEFVDLLERTARIIKNADTVEQVAYLVNSVSVLCLSTFPGKHETVNFLIQRLRTDIHY